MKGCLPLCYGCQSQGHFKKDPPSYAEHPTIEKKAVVEEGEEEEETASVVGVTDLKMEVKPATVAYEEISPATSSTSSASPKVKRRRWMILEERKEEPNKTGAPTEDMIRLEENKENKEIQYAVSFLKEIMAEVEILLRENN